MTSTDNKFCGLKDNHCLAFFGLKRFGQIIYILEMI